ncbi:histidine phosphatase family protein [Roseovarius sp. LXJ103]|uniref:histidine phosphatase family protein n=1 Tax=Roseovarius carneus TaxID=2853164 RepID=UPI000D612D62|nr:histidine phosphatase family protein [Roseovarius carneus]MBZ8119403.1 histidine phosphatase family protein [Roseovarius carneus]PWE34951.1 histidine phosphatase family protein [Pelagicola sp. LXJ1103]
MTAKYPDIWFLRHGQTEWNLARRIQGGLDSPLTDLGLAQARMQARLMVPIIPQVLAAGGGIYVSPLGRAQQTAALALPGVQWCDDPRLSEIDTGAWEGALKAGLPEGSSELDTYTSAPGGEGWEGLEARVAAFLSDLDAPAIIVAHGMLGQVLRGQVMGLSRTDLSHLSNGQGCVYALSGGSERRFDLARGI